MLVAERVTVRYPGAARPAVADLSVTVAPGRLVAVVGPNGSGKTSLIRVLVGAVEPASGTVLLDGRPLSTWPTRDRARRLGLVAQREEHPFPWRVREVVAFGRYPWIGPVAPLGPADTAAIERAMARADVGTLAERRIDTLSGGEWQRVRIARALAQEPAILLLDEPTAALDLGHEMEIFELVRQLTDEGIASLVVTHHLNHAARFADEIVLLHEGRVEAAGPPMSVLAPERIERVFGWPVVRGTVEGAPQIVPVRRSGRP